jgi:KipI family sensor histidine kinase inhibitor
VQLGVPHISWSSDRTLRIEFGDAIDPATQARVHRALRALRDARIEGVVDLVPAYATLAAAFDVARLDHARAERDVRAALEGVTGDSGASPARARTIDIPVDYGGVHGPDLPVIAERAGLDQRRAAELHASGVYTVCFLGFAPGFAYLAGLPAPLATPRLATPRPRVPAGSVAIAGAQSGVYPSNSPGGWRLIGRTRMAMFDPARAEPALLRAGDLVRFVVASFSPAAGATP